MLIDTDHTSLAYYRSAPAGASPLTDSGGCLSDPRLDDRAQVEEGERVPAPSVPPPTELLQGHMGGLSEYGPEEAN